MAGSKITKFPEAFARQAEERARLYEAVYHGCAECVLVSIQEMLEINDPLVLRIAGCLTGGLGRTGRTCGALLGGIMALGLKYGRNDLEEGLEGLRTGQRATYDLVKWFEKEFGSTDCRGLTKIDFTDEKATARFVDGPNFEKICVKVVSQTARHVAENWNKEPKGWPGSAPAKGKKKSGS